MKGLEDLEETFKHPR